MRRRESQLVALLASVAALVIANATSASELRPAKGQPIVTVLGSGPVTIKGAGFMPRERVSIRLSIQGANFSRVMRATLAGRVAARFENATLPECARYTIVVTGMRSGRNAVMRNYPPPCGYFPQP